MMLWLGFPLGFFASGYFSGLGAFLTELFPTRLRGSGQGFCYNFGRGMGALFPALVGYFSSQYGLAAAIAVFAVIAYGVFLAAALLLPETRGRELYPD
jgi:MFS family permease